MSHRSLPVGGSFTAAGATAAAADIKDDGSRDRSVTIALMVTEPMLGTEQQQQQQQQQLENVRKEEEEAYMRAIMCRAILPVVVLVIIIGLVVMLFVINSTPSLHGATGSLSQPILYSCHDPCRASWVESTPANLSLSNSSGVESTSDAWTSLIASAASTIDVLTGSISMPPSPSSANASMSLGLTAILSDSLLVAAKRGVSVRIMIDYESGGNTSTADVLKGSADSAANQNLTILRLNFSAIVGGPLDATFVVVDGRHFYLGSAYAGRNPLPQNREMGMAVRNCSCLAGELQRLFNGYSLLVSGNANASTPWPREQDAHYNASTPLNVTFAVSGASSAAAAAAYFTVSLASSYRPPSMSQDADSIVAAVTSASSEVDIAVANYSPVSDDGSTFWPMIDNAVRAASLRPQMSLRLLVGIPEAVLKCSNDSSVQLVLRQRLRSLTSLTGFSDRVQAKLYVLPSSGVFYTGLQSDRPASWSNYMIADGVAYVGTSDWTATSFSSAFRMGFVVNETATTGPSSTSTGGGLRAQLQAIFARDWSYARSLTAAAVCQP